MKINKFKKNKISKFRNTKLYKGIVVGMSALTLATALSACREEKQLTPILHDTILENAVVATVDGDIEILKEEYVYKDHHICYYDENDKLDNHKHYRNIVTGEWLADSQGYCDTVNTSTSWSINNVNPRNADISNIESITNYLTEEEYQKAIKGELTEDDIIKIITRVKSISVENETQKSR